MSKIRLKRPCVNWFKVLMSSNDDNLIHDYYVMRCKTKFELSKNRCAYAVLVHYYPRTKLDRVRWLGEAL